MHYTNPITMYQVDAFTDTLFSGNPAAVCMLNEWLPDRIMQQIAAENNLAETAFAVQYESYVDIRWFTPIVEVDLCGHATLATAFVLFEQLHYPKDVLLFHSARSGPLSVMKKASHFFLDFPTDTLIKTQSSHTTEIAECIGVQPLEVLKGKTDFLAVIDSEETLQLLQLNVNKIAALDARGLIVTAPGNSVDFVSRFFAPQCGVPEDPVTGSAHTSLIPYWSNKLGKKDLVARQISSRGGDLWCKDDGDRCIIGGQARLYLIGEINIQ